MWAVVEFFGTMVSLLLAFGGLQKFPPDSLGWLLLGVAAALTIWFVVDEYRFMRVPKHKCLKEKKFYRYMAELILTSGDTSVTIVSGSLSWAEDANVLKALMKKGSHLTVYMQAPTPVSDKLQRADVRVRFYGHKPPRSRFTIIGDKTNASVAAGHRIGVKKDTHEVHYFDLGKHPFVRASFDLVDRLEIAAIEAERRAGDAAR